MARKHALAHPARGHRKIWAMVRHDGHVVSEATILRLLRAEELILPEAYQRERRKLAERRKAAFAQEPTGPTQVWQLDFSEFETTSGGTWRLAGCRDYWSKYEHPFHVSPTANQHDAVDAIELALGDYEAMFGHPLVDLCPVDEQTGELLPVAERSITSCFHRFNGRRMASRASRRAGFRGQVDRTKVDTPTLDWDLQYSVVPGCAPF